METVQMLINKINNKKFKGLEMYNIGSALPMMATNVHFNSKMSVKNKLWTIIQWVLFNAVEYKYFNKNSNIMLVYSDERINRVDYRKIFENVKGIFDSDTITPIIRQKKEVHSWHEIAQYLELVFSWLGQLRKCGIDLKNSMRVVTDIMRIYNIHQYLETVTFSHKDCIIVFCDIFPTDNICVQYFQHKGIMTMTLQHAAFTAALKEPTNINDAGIELTYSISDYFLGWNQFTKEQAISCGMKEERFRVVGIPQFINYASELSKENQNNCFGVILGVKEYDDINRSVVKIANEIAEKYCLKYYLKYHPNFKGNEYSDITNEYCLGNFTSRDINEYVRSVDFSVLSVTSMIVELVYLEHTIYRFKIEPDKDKFSEINVFNFSNLKEFAEIYKKPQEGLFDYLCYTRYIGEAYRKTIQNILDRREHNE